MAPVIGRYSNKVLGAGDPDMADPVVILFHPFLAANLPEESKTMLMAFVAHLGSSRVEDDWKLVPYIPVATRESGVRGADGMS